MAAVTTLPAAFVAGNVLTAAQQNDLRGAFRILQVVTATTATQVNTTSTTYVTSGLAVTITPSSNTSKIFIIASTAGLQASSALNLSTYTLFRGTVAGTNLGVADGMAQIYGTAVPNHIPVCVTFLDSPATTSATTYTLGMKSLNAATTTGAQVSNTTASITVFEVSA